LDDHKRLFQIQISSAGTTTTIAMEKKGKLMSKRSSQSRKTTIDQHGGAELLLMLAMALALAPQCHMTEMINMSRWTWL